MDPNNCFGHACIYAAKLRSTSFLMSPSLTQEERYGHACKQLPEWCAWGCSFSAHRRGKSPWLGSALSSSPCHRAHLHPAGTPLLPAWSHGPASFPGICPISMRVSHCSSHRHFCSEFGFSCIFQQVRRTYLWVAKHPLRQKNTPLKVQLIQSYCILSQSSTIWFTCILPEFWKNI